jgi:hypothetical protein
MTDVICTMPGTPLEQARNLRVHRAERWCHLLCNTLNTSTGGLMPRFSVQVESDNAEQARGNPNAAGIPTIGPAFAYFTQSPDTTTMPGRELVAVVEAENENDAEDRVRQVVGDAGEVGPVRPYS